MFPKGSPWRFPCCRESCTIKSKARACQCYHTTASALVCSTYLPVSEVHLCCRSCSSSPACGSAFGWPRFDKPFLMLTAPACRAELCQVPLHPRAAAVHGGGCPHTSLPPHQPQDMAQPAWQLLAGSNAACSQQKHML